MSNLVDFITFSKKGMLNTPLMTEKLSELKLKSNSTFQLY